MSKKEHQTIHKYQQFLLKNISRFKKYYSTKNICLVVFIVGMGTGFLLHGTFMKPKPDSNTSIREDDGRFSSPILVCDTDEENQDSRLDELKRKLVDKLEEYSSNGTLSNASIYYRDYADGATLSINPDERYIPASLNKVPMMITAYKYAENDPDFLSKKAVYESSHDANSVQIIKPQETLTSGSTYSVEEAIEKMMLYSDNASYDFLTNFLDYEDYIETFNTLKIPVELDVGLTAYEYSYFLRVLYNATYLDPDYSEKALSLLSRSEYNDGLKAGIPKNIQIAHKFGLSGGVDVYGNPINRQLHECGIVYANTVYLLCVMTKSPAQISEIEAAIADISHEVYEFSKDGVEETHYE